LLSSLALVASAAGTTPAHSTKVRHLQQPVAALAVDGDRVAYDLGARNATSKHATNRVLVWNVRTGKTVKVSGRKTAAGDGTSTGSGVFQLAIAGSRVAWLLNEGGNSESTDFLFTSSAARPNERKAATAQRSGDDCPGREPTCAGQWLGGLVGSGNTIAFNRWTTDSSGATTSGGLYTLSGSQTKSIATGTSTVQAVSSDAGREAVLHSDGSVTVYSKSGGVLMTLPPASAKEAALSGKDLVVVSETRQLQVYDSNGSLKKTLPTHGSGLHNLDVQGKIAIYTTGPSVRAVNLSSGKTRAVATLGKHSEILFARISSAGLAYAANGVRASFGKSTLAFVPLARIKAAVG
jgi:hypothetical protein